MNVCFSKAVTLGNSMLISEGYPQRVSVTSSYLQFFSENLYHEQYEDAALFNSANLTQFLVLGVWLELGIWQNKATASRNLHSRESKL